jgi:hypothetical protein
LHFGFVVVVVVLRCVFTCCCRCCCCCRHYCCCYHCFPIQIPPPLIVLVLAVCTCSRWDRVRSALVPPSRLAGINSPNAQRREAKRTL